MKMPCVVFAAIVCVLGPWHAAPVLAQPGGVVIRNVLGNCFLSVNGNGEVSCDRRQSRGSRWSLLPGNDAGTVTRIESIAFNCTLGADRRNGSASVSCYGAAAERNGELGFSLRREGRNTVIFNARRRCALYGGQVDNFVECLGLEGSADQRWLVVDR
jgi:hypothetical protein